MQEGEAGAETDSEEKDGVRKLRVEERRAGRGRQEIRRTREPNGKKEKKQEKKKDEGEQEEEKDEGEKKETETGDAEDDEDEECKKGKQERRRTANRRTEFVCTKWKREEQDEEEWK